MKIAIRTDSSTAIGTGHVMRCLTLADSLREKGATVTFVCREHIGNLCSFIEDKGFKIYRLPIPYNQNEKLEWNNHASWLGVPWKQDTNETISALRKSDEKFDLLIIDHYALDNHWEVHFRPIVKNIMVIDDLADRSHNCDFLLDQNLYPNFINRYNGLLPKDCKKLLGPQFALLRPEFRIAREHMKNRDGCIKRILVFLGGSDPDNITTRTIKAIELINLKNRNIDVVIGPQNLNKDKIYQKNTLNPFFNIYENVTDMASLMNSADIMIGAGGTTTWERCCLGLPSLIISIADNQIEIAKGVDSIGAAVYLGSNKNVNVEDIAEALQKLLNNPAEVKSMSKNALQLIDGLGTQRVSKELMNEV